MLENLERKVFMEEGPRRIHYLEPLDYDAAEGLGAEVIRQLVRDFQPVPPVTLHLPRPRLMAGMWAAARETVVAGSPNRAKREAILATVSRINACPFCVETHTTMLLAADLPEVARAIARDTDGSELGGDWRRIIEWAAATLSPDTPILAAPPFPPGETPQMIGSAIVFHYVNRMVNVFLDDSPLPLPNGLKWLKGTAGRIAAWAFGRRLMAMRVDAGDMVLEIDGAPLPGEFAWAKPNPDVARAFATFATVAEEAGRESLCDEVRALVAEFVGRWRGEAPGPGLGWLDEATAGLSARQRAEARLALLTALASYRVDEGTIADFRAHRDGDADLVGAAGWASYTAARRIAGWLRGPA